MQILTVSEQQAVGGGIAPAVVAVGAFVTSDAFVGFVTAVGLIGTAMDIATELLES